MKKNLVLLGLICLSTYVQSQEKYVYDVDLQNVKNDKVKIILTPPKISSRKATFVMPSVIPGSYSRKDYGRFVKDIKAFDKNGKQLKIKNKKVNLFKISKAKKLARVEYLIDDTWDHEEEKNWVFQPGGSNIEADTNFLINNHAFFGYFNKYKNLPFEINFKKPDHMYGASPLKKTQKDKETDTWFAKNYVDLVDNPLMYAEPDTVTFDVNNTKVHISVYSGTKKIKAAKIAEYLQPLSKALGNFFGQLPVDNYHFIFYFSDRNSKSSRKGLGGFGALEHSYSSVYYLPEITFEPALKGIVQDVGAHEFLHILTPLNIHSEQIEDFNFIKPDMSKHLWMYEGVTEYFSLLVQVRDSLISSTEFMDKIREKIQAASKFEAVSFTHMSENIVDPKYQDPYLNVYQRGALIGFGLDLLLTKLSDGTYGLKELMMELSKKYGPNKPFKDDELIGEIVQMTYPEVQSFFDKWVIGEDNIDYKALFDIIGWEYVAVKEIKGFSFGSFRVAYNREKDNFYFDQVNENALDLEDGDVLVDVNGTTINLNNFNDLLSTHLFDKKTPDSVLITVKRTDELVQLSAKPTEEVRLVTDSLMEKEDLTDKQKKFQRFLLTGKTEE